LQLQILNYEDHIVVSDTELRVKWGRLRFISMSDIWRK